jgi:hypothetical protein
MPYIWYDAISDNVNHSELFDVFGNDKGRVDELEASSADIWFDTVTPDQHARAKIEEATFICSEHAHRVHHFDNDDFKAVLLANATESNTANDKVKDKVDKPACLSSAARPVHSLFLPLVVSMKLIKPDAVLIVPRYLNAVHVLLASLVRS